MYGLVKAMTHRPISPNMGMPNVNLNQHITLLIHMAFPVCDVVQHVVEIMQFKCNVSLQLKPADAVIFAVTYVWLIIFSNLLKKLEMVS